MHINLAVLLIINTEELSPDLTILTILVAVPYKYFA